MLQRYRFPRCLRTCSILKDGMLPYRRVNAEQLQSCLDNPQQSQTKTESHKLPKPVLSRILASLPRHKIIAYSLYQKIN